MPMETKSLLKQASGSRVSLATPLILCSFPFSRFSLSFFPSSWSQCELLVVSGILLLLSQCDFGNAFCVLQRGETE